MLGFLSITFLQNVTVTLFEGDDFVSPALGIQTIPLNDLMSKNESHLHSFHDIWNFELKENVTGYDAYRKNPPLKGDVGQLTILTVRAYVDSVYSHSNNKRIMDRPKRNIRFC